MVPNEKEERKNNRVTKTGYIYIHIKYTILCPCMCFCAYMLLVYSEYQEVEYKITKYTQID